MPWYPISIRIKSAQKLMSPMDTHSACRARDHGSLQPHPQAPWPQNSLATRAVCEWGVIGYELLNKLTLFKMLIIHIKSSWTTFQNNIILAQWVAVHGYTEHRNGNGNTGPPVSLVVLIHYIASTDSVTELPNGSQPLFLPPRSQKPDKKNK